MDRFDANQSRVGGTITWGTTHTVKITGYVHPDSAAYLKKLAATNSRKISAQLDLILKEHQANAETANV